MSNESIAAHFAAEDLLESVLAAVPEVRWDAPTTCTDWSVRDIAAHVTWGCDLLRLRAQGEEIADLRAAPGAERPSEYIDGDPLGAYRAARKACDEVLTPESLSQPAPAFVRSFNPEATLREFIGSMTADAVTHSWDIADALGLELTVPPALVEVSRKATAGTVPRVPGVFAPEVTPPAGADGLEQLVAYLGRTSLRSKETTA